MSAAGAKKTLVFRSLLIAAALTILKLAAGTTGQSMAVLASAADSLMDFVISLANFMFIEKAEKPADADHPYGHGKIESLAGLVQALFIGVVAVGIATGTLLRFLNPKPVTHAGAGILVMAVSLVLNWWHARNLRRSRDATHSTVIANEYLHYASDFLGHAGVIISLVLFHLTGQLFWDPLASLLVVGYVLWSVRGILRNAIAELLDEQLPEPVLGEIAKIIRAHDRRIAGFHQLRTRRVGDTKFIEFHVGLREITDFNEAHALTDALITRLQTQYPGSIITVHSHPEAQGE